MCNYNPNTTDYYSYIGQHVHEIVGSTAFSSECEVCHNHRFAAMTDVAVEAEGSHFHNVIFRTDTHDEHIHEFCGPSTLAIPTGDGRHVHFLNGHTKPSKGHAHEFRVVSMINNPTDTDGYRTF